jgi:hypothetical protein
LWKGSKKEKRVVLKEEKRIHDRPRKGRHCEDEVGGQAPNPNLRHRTRDEDEAKIPTHQISNVC